ncbi:MAG TPA: alpha/beta hydrolase [Pyrinomonadaceae bacterium]|jgi:pimeloyl-ACP methyl ester carboxylesterase
MKTKHLALGIGGAVGAAVAWKLLTRPGAVEWDKVSEKVLHSENSHFVEIDGATVHYQEFGDRSRPTLLLIHGFTASVYVWNQVAPALADEDFHVVAVDLIGFGYSDKPAWFDYKISSQARMISRFMNRLGIGRADIVGSSYGGAVALTLALDYPERVEKLVLVDAVINDEATSHPIMRLAKIPGVGEVITPFLVDSKRFMKFRMQGTLAPVNHHLITKDRIESVIRPLQSKEGHRAVLQSGRNWDANRIERDAHLVSQPTLIVWGEEDTVIPIKCGESLYNSILNSRFVVLKDCGHVPQEEKPELFTSLVSSFCHDRKGRIDVGESGEMRLEN